ncbi:MAG: methyltransferase [Desulfobulbaceae bacterium]|nr:methyltransferase [Desulfobulbaceae bacterium]
MTGISLAEYNPAAPRQQLHALLKTAGGFVAELRGRLEHLCPGVAISHDPEQQLLLVSFPEEGERAGFLQILVAVLDVYAGLPAGTVPELLETRLVALPGEGEVVRRPFSRHLRLAEEPVLPADPRPCLGLEHGTSFGSGRHPSTRLAMAALDRLRETETTFPARVLDIGCGSGILALACGLLGAREVLGIDIDAGALAVAADNAANNQLAGRVSFSGQTLAEQAGSYGLLVANVTGAVMSGMVADFARLAGEGSWLVISGLQGRQLGEMVAVLGEMGFAEVARFSEEPWGAGLLQRRSQELF